MYTSEIVQAWGKILKGEKPPAFDRNYQGMPVEMPRLLRVRRRPFGGGPTPRDLNDRRGQALVDGVLEVVYCIKPLHLSIVGANPMVRYRELELIIPQLLARGVHVQIVTSVSPNHGSYVAETGAVARLVVSIDGCATRTRCPARPRATDDRILRNIAGQRVTIHCTVTGQMMKRPGYLGEFLEFWTPRPEIKKVWFKGFYASGRRSKCQKS